MERTVPAYVVSLISRNWVEWASVFIILTPININKKARSVPEREVVSTKWIGCCGWCSSVSLYCLASPPSLEAAQLRLEAAIEWHKKWIQWSILKTSSSSSNTIPTKNLIRSISWLPQRRNWQKLRRLKSIPVNLQHWRLYAHSDATEVWSNVGRSDFNRDWNTHHRINGTFLSCWSLGTSSETGMAWITCMILQERGRMSKTTMITWPLMCICSTFHLSLSLRAHGSY